MTTLKRDYNITVTESRGRWSYLPENRQRPITWRRLGDDYSKEAIEASILQRPIIESVIPGRIIDLNNPKIKSNYGLTQRAKIQNLKTMSQTVNFLTENHLLNMDKLPDTITDTRQQFKDDTQHLRWNDG